MSQSTNSLPISYRLQPPEELVFKGPFNDYVSQKLRIENTGDTAIGFKVKTTTPKKFSVKPNMGCIESHGSQDILICLHSFSYDPNDKTRHKFMVQIVSLTSPTDAQSVEAMIKDFERSNPTKLKESKLRVAIVPAPADVEKQNIVNGNVYPGPPQSTASPTSAGLNQQHLPTLEDFKQLEADLSNLRSENTQLKDENAHQRKLISELERGAGGLGVDSKGMSTASSSSNSMQRIIFLIFILFIGMVMGFYISNKSPSSPMSR